MESTGPDTSARESDPPGPRCIPEEIDEHSNEWDDEDDNDPEQLAGESEIRAPDYSDGDEQPDEDPRDERRGGKPRTEGVSRRHQAGLNLSRTIGAAPVAKQLAALS